MTFADVVAAAKRDRVPDMQARLLAAFWLAMPNPVPYETLGAFVWGDMRTPRGRINKLVQELRPRLPDEISINNVRDFGFVLIAPEGWKNPVESPNAHHR